MSEPQVAAETAGSASAGAQRSPAETQATPDPQLLSPEARAQARAALAEITPTETIGAEAGYEVHDASTVTLFFESKLDGYPSWRWAAAIARVGADAPVTVLEVEMLPGEGAMLAPEWVPWSERLSQYRDAQARQREEAAAEEAAAELADLDDADDDVLDNDYSDFDDELDGVDLDEELDGSGDDGSGDDDSDRDDSDGDDSDDDSDGDDDSDDDAGSDDGDDSGHGSDRGENA